MDWQTSSPELVNLNRLSRRQLLASLMPMVGLGAPSFATADDSEQSRLDADLTPVGAHRAGNADQSIPAWTGGLSTPPPGFDPAKGYVDPFASERPFVVITAENASAYRDKLADGQLEMLRRYPSYRLPVYTTHRTAAYPRAVVEQARVEARAAALAPGGNGVVGVHRSTVPFPIAKTGLEVIWNHLFRYRGGSVQRSTDTCSVRVDGSFIPVRVEEHLAFAAAMAKPEANRLAYFLGVITSPSSLAGLGVLAIDPMDQAREARLAWTYNPGQRRVLRAPSLGYDMPADGADGLRTIDDFDGFNGAPDRYNWQLLGRREMIISYNNFRITSKSLHHADLIRPLHMNPDHLRYELHRVWVVEARLKAGARHIYARRVFYVDEDSWQIAHVDKYDSRGQLWRVQEGHAVQFYDALALWYAAEVGYDLEARRYLVNGLTNEAPAMRFGVPLEAGFFTSESLRRLIR